MSRNQNRRGGRKRGREGRSEWLADARDVATLSNDSFDDYYRGGIVPEAQWSAFAASLRRQLPMALRVHPSADRAADVLAYVRERLAAELPVTTIPFVPGGFALQCAVSRGDLKRSAPLRELKLIIAALNEGGCLTRQETVSMIPAVLLDVQPGHRVLDMCAAPGSKTSQMLDVLVSDKHHGGVVVANDLNASRLDVLLHQTSRTPCAHAHLIVTHYDAAHFPLSERFDRVLCDVMCSGDGTLRKSPDLWPRWNALQGADLHAAQVRVLLRGMALCRRGGRVVYSTCSLNPVEDEAVVAACLARAGAAFRLADPQPRAPGLVAAPGAVEWALTTRDGTARLRSVEEAQAFAEAERGAKGGKKGFQYKETMFADTAQLREQNMHYARRVLPHMQDTGGFFVAVLECVEEFQFPDAAGGGKGKEKDKDTEFRRPALQPISLPLQDTVRTALGLPAEFPTARLFTRNESAREQKLYYANEATMELASRLGPRIIHVGCKVIESYAKHSNELLRFSPDGAAMLATLMPPERIAEISADWVLTLSRTGAVPESALVAAKPSHGFPPDRSFLLRCEMAVVGPVFIAAERIRPGQISAKIFDWQAALAKLTLGQPLASPSDAKSETDSGDCEKEETKKTEGNGTSQDKESCVVADGETLKE